jgi:hypothetical protein
MYFTAFLMAQDKVSIVGICFCTFKQSAQTSHTKSPMI